MEFYETVHMAEVWIQGDFAPHPRPWGHLTMSGDVFAVVASDGSCYWNPMDRGPGLNTPQCMGQPPTAKTKSIQNASGVQAEKLWFMVSRSTLSLKISSHNCDEVG